MKTTIHVSQVLHDGAVTGRHSGRLLRERVTAALAVKPVAVVDFSGVDLITQSAADEFIGRIFRQSPAMVERIQFAHCSHDVAQMLQWAAEHANAVFQSRTDAVPA